ncbi:MAG: (Fe-S)-binding protein [Desulfobacca sp.]|uniref:(Fe-S)-binding protein n=1 Tax=Desulfobacca sp. TaxID=2067990 RepID=UPI004049E4A4
MAVRLFLPCFVDQWAPEVGQAVLALLKRLEIPWSYPAAQTCCGQFAYHDGDWTGARGLMRHFLQVFNGAGPILCPGPACVRMVRRHYRHLAKTPEEIAGVDRLVAQLFELSEILAARLPWPFPLTWPGRVFWHKSCAARDLGLLPTLEQVFSKVSGLELCTLPPAYACCGFGGLFAVKQPELSTAIGWRYLQAVLATGAQVLVSPDVGCLLHLGGVVRAHALPLRVLHLAQFLEAAARRAESEEGVIVL